MKKWAEWLLVAGALCMGMAGCGSEEKTRRTQMQNRKVRLHQRQEKKDRHRSRRIQKEAKRQNYRQQSQNMQRRDSLSQILQRCSLNFAVVQVDGQRILPLRRMALFPAYITIQIWGIPGMAIRMEPCITAIFQTFHELNEGRRRYL